MTENNNSSDKKAVLIRSLSILHRFFLILAITPLMFMFSGCEELQPTVIIVLIDETDSYVSREMSSGNQGTISMWESSIKMTGNAIDMMRPGDFFALVGVDHHGFDSLDIRIPLTELPRASLPSMKVKDDLKQEVYNLAVRETSSGFKLPGGNFKGVPFGTDILGTLHHAAEIVSSPIFDGVHIRIIIFSDFFNEPPEGGTGATTAVRPFSGDCRIIALNVLESKDDPESEETWEEEHANGGEEYGARRAAWLMIFNNMGLECSAGYFCATAGSPEAIVLKLLEGWLRPPVQNSVGCGSGS